MQGLRMQGVDNPCMNALEDTDRDKILTIKFEKKSEKISIKNGTTEMHTRVEDNLLTNM